jgi:hypothetical protein
MNKHQKAVKRERRKAQRRRSIRNGGAALAAAAAIAAGTNAYAEPIRYNNPAGPGHFDWADGADAAPVFLDIVAPASGQPGVEGSCFSLLSQRRFPGHSFISGAARVETGGYFDLYAIPHAAGDLIPSGAPFADGDVTYAGYSLLTEGVQTYLGVRFSDSPAGGNWRYGWVGVVRTGYELDAFAWGYETEVGVPIAAGAPEPGSLALLALGAVGAMSRRRRQA